LTQVFKKKKFWYEHRGIPKSICLYHYHLSLICLYFINRYFDRLFWSVVSC